MNAPTRRVNELKNCSASFFSPFSFLNAAMRRRDFSPLHALAPFVCVCVCAVDYKSLYVCVYVCVSALTAAQVARLIVQQSFIVLECIVHSWQHSQDYRY